MGTMALGLKLVMAGHHRFESDSNSATITRAQRVGSDITLRHSAVTMLKLNLGLEGLMTKRLESARPFGPCEGDCMLPHVLQL